MDDKVFDDLERWSEGRRHKLKWNTRVKKRSTITPPPNWRPQRPYYTLEEYKEWWPNFVPFERQFFDPENCPEPQTDENPYLKGKRYQVVGRWGMFTELYFGGFGTLRVGEIELEVPPGQTRFTSITQMKLEYERQLRR